MRKPLETGDRFAIQRKNDVLMKHFYSSDTWTLLVGGTSTEGYRGWLKGLDIGIEIDSFVFVEDGLETTWYRVVDGPKYMLYILRGEARKQMLVW